MIVNIPIGYGVEGVPKGKRSPQKLSFWEYYQFEIPEISPLDAPVAIEWNDLPAAEHPLDIGSEYNDWIRIQKIPNDGLQEIRHIDGVGFVMRHHQHKTVAEWKSDLKPGFEADFFGEIRIHRKTPNGGAWQLVGSEEADNPFAFFEQSIFRDDKPINSERDDAIAKIKEKLGGVYSINGILYERVSEPVLFPVTYKTLDKNDPRGKSYNLITQMRVAPIDVVKSEIHHTSGSLKYPIIYNVSAYDNIISSQQEAIGDLIVYIKEERKPNVYLPHLFRYNDAFENLITTLRESIQKAYNHEKLNSIDPDEGIAFLNLKKEFMLFEEDGNLRNIVKLTEEFLNHRDYQTNLKAALKQYNDKELNITAEFGSLNLHI